MSLEITLTQHGDSSATLVLDVVLRDTSSAERWLLLDYHPQMEGSARDKTSAALCAIMSAANALAFLRIRVPLVLELMLPRGGGRVSAKIIDDIASAGMDKVRQAVLASTAFTE